MKKSGSQIGKSSSQLIDARIDELGDWRGEMLGRLRDLIKAADPEVVEEWKWDVPVWSHDGIICTGEAYKTAVKLTCEGSGSERSFEPLQLQSRGQHAACDRLPRGRQDKRGGVQDSHSERRDPEQVQS